MKLIWNGHSCFTIEAGGSVVVVNPYQDETVSGHAPLALAADDVVKYEGNTLVLTKDTPAQTAVLKDI